MSDLNLAPHEWAMIHKALEPIIKNGGWSHRHMEGAVLVILQAIRTR